MAASRLLPAELEKVCPSIDVKLTVNVMLLGTFAEAAVSDALLLIPVSLVVTALMMFLFVRSIKPSIAILTLLTLSSGSAMGVAGWLGFVINPASIAAPIIILTVNMASAVRIVTPPMHLPLQGDRKSGG